MTILAVDNNRDRLLASRTCLQYMFPGASVIVFTDPLLAVQYSFRNPIDILFTEREMRGMDGVTLSEGVRQRNGRAKIIFSSDRDRNLSHPDFRGVSSHN